MGKHTINRVVNQLDRRNQGREEYPSIFSIDSQSVKLSPHRRARQEFLKIVELMQIKKLMAVKDSYLLTAVVDFGLPMSTQVILEMGQQPYH